ncbi:MAG: hypothetical protein ACYS1A_00055 [Planctomycetota bacterium]|jgi:membrane protein implicated in regulation of membrane protease activity
MSFRFYSKAISRASRGFAAGIFVTGLILIGFGFLIYVLRELFAILFAIIFCVAGIGCAITAIKILWVLRKFNKINSGDSHTHREDVRIHIEEHFDA